MKPPRADAGENGLGSPGPAVSLVVPVRNEESSLEALVGSIRAQTRPPQEIILVDGGSTDQTVRLARELTGDDPRFRVLEAETATPGRGRNLGIAAASHDWIGLTDAGIRLSPTWLEQLCTVVREDPAVRVVYGNYDPEADTFFRQCAALAYVPAKQPRNGKPMRGPSVASALLHRDVWRSVGGFPDLRASEDLIFMERIESRGFPVGWAPEATVTWKLQPTLATTFRKFVVYSKHNVWADRQRYWHHGVLRMYLAAGLLIVLAIVHSPWWIPAIPLGAAARVVKGVWRRREDRGWLWVFNPFRLVGVGVLISAIDAATFAGWLLACWEPRPQCSSPEMPTRAGEG